MTSGIDLKCFDWRCTGESHKATDKPCQDYSFSTITSDHSIALISDGHGGNRYFRSDVGSRLLCEETARCFSEFVANLPQSTFSNKAYTTIGIGDAMPTVLHRLIGAIVVGWRKSVMEHVANNPITQTERLIADPQNEYEWEKTYGCTLIAALYTPSFWLAIQVGDGKCVAIRDDGTPFEPIPWDERCFLNMTTSICDTDAPSRFRCCFGKIETAPIAIFLGSDGIDDSFGEDENLYNFYIQLAKGFARDGYESTFSDLRRSLPILSRVGSQDDISVAGIYDNRLTKLLPKLLQWQIDRMEKKLQQARTKYDDIWNNLDTILNKSNLKTTFNDLTRLGKEIIEIDAKITKLKKERKS